MIGAAQAKVRNAYTLKQRINIIAGLIRHDLTDSQRAPKLRALAASIVRSCPARGDSSQKTADFCELNLVFDWIATNVRYSGDIGPGREKAMDLYQAPLRTIEWGIGDCDDMVAVAVALLRMLGWHAWARVTSHSGDAWQHIYAVVGFDKVSEYREIVFDPTLGHNRLGHEAAYKKKVDFEV